LGSSARAADTSTKRTASVAAKMQEDLNMPHLGSPPRKAKQ
jgi:hypothetical protein